MAIAVVTGEGKFKTIADTIEEALTVVSSLAGAKEVEIGFICGSEETEMAFDPDRHFFMLVEENEEDWSFLLLDKGKIFGVSVYFAQQGKRWVADLGYLLVNYNL